MVKKEIDPDEIREFITDDRGRVNFGRSHGNQKVRVAVEYLEEEDGDQ